MKSICIIPARGGSKRIPRKNLIDFMGKPMIAWTIEAAKLSGVFDKIVVSTDDEDIAEVGRNFGAEVPFLRQENSDDITPVSEATISAVKQAEIFFGEEYELVVQLMANAPIRDHLDISDHHANFLTEKNTFQLSCFSFGWMNPWWAFKLKHGSPEWLHPEGIKARSQDLPTLYCPTGAIWIADKRSLINANSFYGPEYSPSFCEINWKSAVDIDDYEDLEFAKAVFMLKRGVEN